jgi:molybdopterin molybdotransferase
LHAEALAILKARVQPVADVEAVAVADAGGRILAETAIAPHPVPAHTNAAVDGFSFAASDYNRDAGSSFVVAGRSAAGRPLAAKPVPGHAVRIFTGAVMPEGHDTVAMQEDARVDTGGDRQVVRIPSGLKAGANVRKAGEDVRAGEALLQPGAVLRPQDLAALASIGTSTVTCFKRIEVAVVSTGDEIVRAGASLGAGGVYDANAPMLSALVAAAGARISDLGVLPDNLDAVTEQLGEAAGKFDAIITSGGASRGEEDHIAKAIEALGKRHLWQLAVKPGRPMSFGQIGDTIVVGLPGNPVAVFVCFLLYVWPLLRRMGGAPWPEPRRYPLPAVFEFANRKLGRREFWRGILRETPQGLGVDKFARDGSGLISGLRAADGLIDIPEDVPAIKPGDTVQFIPFSEFGIVRQ